MDNSGGNLVGLTSMGTSGDAQNGDKLLNTGVGIYNGATYDRLRAVGVATGTTGGGLLGVGILGFGGTNYNSLTTNSTTYSSKYGLDINLLGSLGTAFTTAGAVNVQGIAGGTTIPVTASIASAQTLSTVTTVGAVTAITNALPAGTNLLGKVGIDQTTLGTTNNVSISASTGAGTSNLLKDDTSFGDGVTTGVLSTTNRLWNGTNYDRMRSASTAANTTGTGLLGSGILGYDGTNWQYVGIDASHNLKVNVESITASNLSTNIAEFGGSAVTLGTQVAGSSIPVALPTATITSLQQPTLQSGSTTAVTQATAANLNATVSIASAQTLATVTTVSAVTSITNALPAGTNAIGFVSENASASSTGWSVNYQTALSNTKTAIKTSAGLMAGWHLYNNNTAVTYIQVWNLATASVTVGSTAPTWIIVIPAGGWEDFTPTMPGIAMNTAITVAATTSASNNTAPTNAIVGNFWYI